MLYESGNARCVDLANIMSPGWRTPRQIGSIVARDRPVQLQALARVRYDRLLRMIYPYIRNNDQAFISKMGKQVTAA